MENIYEAVSANKRRSIIVVVFFFTFAILAFYILSSAFGVLMGYEPGGLGYVGFAFIASGITSFVSYYYSDKIILTISGARAADRKRDFHFFTVTENIALASGLPVPDMYVIEDSAPNAFATGRSPDHAVICATSGLIEKLNRTELESVIAHEMSHIKNYDIRLMSLVAVLVGMIALLGDWFLRVGFRSGRDNKKAGQLQALFLILGIVFAILSPIIAQLIQLAISRSREYLADAGSVAVTRQPSGLISALNKIAGDKEPLEAANKATAHLYFENPFKTHTDTAKDWFSGLFNTHPPIEKRIEALQRMV